MLTVSEVATSPPRAVYVHLNVRSGEQVRYVRSQFSQPPAVVRPVLLALTSKRNPKATQRLGFSHICCI